MDKISELIIKRLSWEQRFALKNLVKDNKIAENEFYNVLNKVESLTEVNLSGIELTDEVINILGFENCCKYFEAVCQQYLNYKTIEVRDRINNPINEVSGQKVNLTVAGNNIDIALWNTPKRIDEIINSSFDSYKENNGDNINERQAMEKVIDNAFATVYFKLKNYNNLNTIEDQKRNEMMSIINNGLNCLQQVAQLKADELILQSIPLIQAELTKGEYFNFGEQYILSFDYRDNNEKALIYGVIENLLHRYGSTSPRAQRGEGHIMPYLIDENGNFTVTNTRVCGGTSIPEDCLADFIKEFVDFHGVSVKIGDEVIQDRFNLEYFNELLEQLNVNKKR